MAVAEFFLALAGIALALAVTYFLYSLIFKAFRRMGFTTGEASAILFGTLIGGLINVPLFPYNGWIVAVNVGGAIVPILISAWLLRRIPSIADEAAVGIVVVSIVTFLVTRATPEGIISEFPYWLLPPMAAAAMSLFAFWRDEDHAAPLAYISGSMGALIGADVLRFQEFFGQAPREPGQVASLGGAAILDMVFLAGIFAVGFDMLLFRQRRKERHDYAIPSYREPLVFTPSTPPDVLADYNPGKDPAVVGWDRPRARTFAESRRAPSAPRPPASRPSAPRAPSSATPPAPSLPPRAPPPPAQRATTASDDRMAAHRAWEERLRQRGRG